MRLNMKMGMVVSRERLEGERWWWLGVMTNITSGHKGPAHPLAMAERPTASSKKRMPPLLSIPSHAPTAVGRRKGRLAV